ncbi:MAG: DNA polymerase III subunit alpha [Moraxellaceae bacterium]|jgi:DNA polymerase-3 subunit alpha|nr:DNA polymerase III subunit alpha [Moraxellaceae bacterium]MBP8851725.1 DNA polymerase III subunit alpha [Moraxellaceae bacterium]MBP9045032.1 DNA polymerase III subunit alpha [Moraxellaceae bacterium]MBP9730063.1 DNA polymerase III subunit alpha [Moraxellaceae bacterium]HQV40573.1 DNA polymerase III subunit alpha [Moraxellaceae bacterium]
MTAFVHLHVRSEFSLKDSIIRIDKLVDAAVKAETPSVAVSDLMNLYGLVKFYNAAQGKGIKPVFGSDLIVREGDLVYEITALVMNEKGYSNLINIVSDAYINGQEMGDPFVSRQQLAACHEGLIVLVGKRSNVGLALLGSDLQVANDSLADWMRIFPQRVYLELVRTGRDGEEDFLHAAMELGDALQCPVVATNDVRFLYQEDFEAHEVRVCIAQSYVLDDSRRPREYTSEQYLKTSEQMIELFSDIPEAIENTVEIARRCTLDITLGKNYLPDYPVPEGMTIGNYLIQHSHECLELRFQDILDSSAPDYAERRKTYTDRLDFELGVINQMGFAGYFLIVMDFIRWAKENGVPVGPGRGSGAGSLVAYALKITDIDPIPYDLLFERFLNPERVSMPDFDVDFCMEGRDRVIEYVANNYGREAVSQIITFGTMAAKAVVRDVARVQSKSYGLADRISKLIPFTPGISLREAREQEPQLDELLTNTAMSDHEDALEIWEMALKLEGITRGVGKHAGGVLIAPGKLTDFTAVFCDEEGRWVSQYDKDDVEKVGLVKFDFLGLRTLTIIDWALKDINAKRARRGEDALDIMALPLNDRASYKLLEEGRTTAVFQLESRGMKELLKKLQPNTFEDLIALVALYRPGPLESGMVDDFINRKHGRAPVAYPDAQYQHECLEPILKPTYGVIVYQEQVMQIAQAMAGYSLGGADMLRRAMGKKKPEEMAKERVKFMAGAEVQKIDVDLAGHIFDLMEKFAGYGFNKSHSAAYALVSYQTAWLKVHYPAEFMAAVLSSEMHNTDKIVTFIEECREMKLKISPPDVNLSRYKFVTTDEGTIIYGLGAIKGVGEGPIDNVVQSREVDGSYKDLFDFCRRVDLRKSNKRTLEGLVRAGALDGLGPHRGIIMASLDEAVAAAEQQARNADAGIVDLFGDVVEEAPSGEFIDAPPWTDDERLTAEKDTLGLYLTGHPIDQYESELSHFVEQRLSDLQPTRRGVVTTVAGLVLASRIQKGQRGSRAFVTLDDRTGRIEVALFSDAYEQFRHLMVKDTVVVVEGEVSHDEYAGGLKMVVRKVMTLAEARTNRSRGLEIRVDAASMAPRFVHDLKQLLEGHRPAAGQKGAVIRLHYRRPDVEATLRLGDDWRVNPGEDLLKRLRQQLGKESVQVLY